MVAQSGAEWFDVVDHRDVVVGRERRATVHRRGLRHRGVHVFVFRPGGDVFLQRRARGKDTFPGRWDSSCSGHTDAGEGYAAAAVRELGEELGLDLPGTVALEGIDYVEACEATGQEFVRLYRLEHPGPFRLNPAEIEAGRWFAPDDLRRALERDPSAFTPPFRLLWGRWVGV